MACRIINEPQIEPFFGFLLPSTYTYPHCLGGLNLSWDEIKIRNQMVFTNKSYTFQVVFEPLTLVDRSISYSRPDDNNKIDVSG